MLLPFCGAFKPAEVLYACSPVTTAAHSTFSKFSWPGCCGRGRAPQLARALLLLRSKACVLGQLLWTPPGSGDWHFDLLVNVGDVAKAYTGQSFPSAVIAEKRGQKQ